ncbi:MAG: FAD-dependent oxidoreductase, partial [Methylophilaceae bacterium]
MLDQPSALEAEVLSAIPYQENEIALHYDRQLMPKKKLAWAAWNYHIPKQAMDKVAVTYNMNILQSLQSQEPLLVTLNYLQDIDPNKIIKRLV